MVIALLRSRRHVVRPGVLNVGCELLAERAAAFLALRSIS